MVYSHNLIVEPITGRVRLYTIEKGLNMDSGEVYQAEATHEPIDIILPTHGKLNQLTIPCVQALYAHTRNKFHLIVMDSSSPDMEEALEEGQPPVKDTTPAFFERLKIENDNITFIHRDSYKNGNQFFNLALEHSKYRFVATVMNSVRVEPDWDIVPTQMMANNPKIGIIGMKCLMGHNGLIESAGIKMHGILPCDMGRDFPSHRLSGSYPCFSVQWAFALLRKEAVAGNLNEEIWQGHVGWDDIDNSIYLRYKGWECWYCGLGVGYHYPHATRGSDENVALMKNRMNAEVFYKRWGYWEQYRKENPYAPEYFKNGAIKFLANADELPLTREGSLLEALT